MTDNRYSDTEILEYAKDKVSDELVNFWFSKWPIDEYDNVDYSEDVGYVPVCSVSSCEVTGAEIYERKEGEILVVVTCDLTWSHEDKDEEEEDNDASFLINVFTDYTTLEHGEIERCN